jgi:hypothetical protein
MLKHKIFQKILYFPSKKFNISINNIINVEAAKIPWYCSDKKIAPCG